jgi:glutamine amidotransferase
MKVGIINIGGNVLSLQKILNYSGFEASILENKNKINEYEAYILPGIGSFDNPLNRLNDLSLLDFFSQPINFKNKILIGVCSGMQILFEESEEGKRQGLSLIAGKVKKFKNIRYKIPHMGWNYLNSNKKTFNYSNKKFYFAHSYYVECEKKFIQTYCDYDFLFPAIVRNKNIWGIQFHPEKSHLNGIQVFKDILK